MLYSPYTILLVLVSADSKNRVNSHLRVNSVTLA